MSVTSAFFIWAHACPKFPSSLLVCTFASQAQTDSMVRRHRRVIRHMDLVLYPRVAPQDRLRVWLGVFAATAAPALNWLLNGVPVVPLTLRAVASVRPDALLPPG